MAMALPIGNNGSVGSSTWTPRLLKAAYNYQVSLKDPGAFAHGNKYIVQLLFDSIADLGGDTSTLARTMPVTLLATLKPSVIGMSMKKAIGTQFRSAA